MIFGIDILELQIGEYGFSEMMRVVTQVYMSPEEVSCFLTELVYLNWKSRLPVVK